MSGERVLVKKHTRWDTSVMRKGYAGQRVKMLQATDWEGRHLALLLTGPLQKAMIWVSDDEIEPEATG